jgi:hypothetical protein
LWACIFVIGLLDMTSYPFFKTSTFQWEWGQNEPRGNADGLVSKSNPNQYPAR